MKSIPTLMRRTVIVLCGTLILCGCQATPAMSPASTEEGFFSKLKSSTNHIAKSFGRTKTRQQESIQHSKLEFPKTELTQGNFASVQFAMGRSLEREGNLQAAKSSYQAAIRNQPKDAAAYHRLALVMERLGEGNSSEELLSKAAELDPRNAEILCDLGYWNALRERNDEARKCYEMALKQDPHLQRAHNNLGLLVASLGDVDRAMLHFNAAGLSVAEARCNLGFANMRQHRWQQAESELQMALHAEPSLEQARTLAKTLDKLHKNQPKLALNPVEKPRSTAAMPATPAHGLVALQDLADEEFEDSPDVAEVAGLKIPQIIIAKPESEPESVAQARIPESKPATTPQIPTRLAEVVESQNRPVDSFAAEPPQRELSAALISLPKQTEALPVPASVPKIQLTTASQPVATSIRLTNPSGNGVTPISREPQQRSELVVVGHSAAAPEETNAVGASAVATDMPTFEGVNSPRYKLQFMQALKEKLNK